MDNTDIAELRRLWGTASIVTARQALSLLDEIERLQAENDNSAAMYAQAMSREQAATNEMRIERDEALARIETQTKELEQLRADNIRLIDQRTENGQLCYERGVHIEAQDKEIERLRAENEDLRHDVEEGASRLRYLDARQVHIEKLEAALRKARGRLIAITRGNIKFGHDPIIGVIDEALERK